MNRASRLRKCLGGTMRQTGYLAAACLFGLNQSREKLKIDHENSQKLVKGLNLYLFLSYIQRFYNDLESCYLFLKELTKLAEM